MGRTGYRNLVMRPPWHVRKEWSRYEKIPIHLYRFLNLWLGVTFLLRAFCRCPTISLHPCKFLLWVIQSVISTCYRWNYSIILLVKLFRTFFWWTTFLNHTSDFQPNITAHQLVFNNFLLFNNGLRRFWCLFIKTGFWFSLQCIVNGLFFLDGWPSLLLEIEEERLFNNPRCLANSFVVIEEEDAIINSSVEPQEVYLHQMVPSISSSHLIASSFSH